MKSYTCLIFAAQLVEIIDVKIIFAYFFNVKILQFPALGLSRLEERVREYPHHVPWSSVSVIFTMSTFYMGILYTVRVTRCDGTGLIQCKSYSRVSLTMEYTYRVPRCRSHGAYTHRVERRSLMLRCRQRTVWNTIFGFGTVWTRNGRFVLAAASAMFFKGFPRKWYAVREKLFFKSKKF
jgi:hypothetical protein